ncbi:MAG: noncanonical pyrimidine nucleotidase, YjjG family [Bacilli bacterium]|nr:noncanonical pyrimidine nucleotidase, YjjG family [Bacilli bacterium]
MRYELLIFDADDTLFDFRKAEKEALENCLKDFNINYDERVLQTFIKINLDVWHELEKGLLTQQELRSERFRRFKDTLNLSFNEVVVAERYLEYLAKASYLFPDVERLIQKLASNYKLILLSNGLSYVQNNRLRKSVIAKYFDDIIISEDVGMAKPDPRIFELALARVNYFEKQKVLMIGDSLSSDILGGNRFGINTCWLNWKYKVNDTNIIPTYEVHSLGELEELLELRETND